MPLASIRSSPSSAPVCGRGNSRISIFCASTCTAARTVPLIGSAFLLLLAEHPLREAGGYRGVVPLGITVLVDDDAAYVLACFQVLVGLVDLLQLVSAADQLVQL